MLRSWRRLQPMLALGRQGAEPVISSAAELQLAERLQSGQRCSSSDSGPPAPRPPRIPWTPTRLLDKRKVYPKRMRHLVQVGRARRRRGRAVLLRAARRARTAPPARAAPRAAGPSTSPPPPPPHPPPPPPGPPDAGERVRVQDPAAAAAPRLPVGRHPGGPSGGVLRGVGWGGGRGGQARGLWGFQAGDWAGGQRHARRAAEQQRAAAARPLESAELPQLRPAAPRPTSAPPPPDPAPHDPTRSTPPYHCPPKVVPEAERRVYTYKGVCLSRANKGPRSWFKLYNVFPDAGGFVQHFPL
jgi:hypothetical protein